MPVELPSSYGAATTNVLPSPAKARLCPELSNGSVLADLTYACCVQMVLLRVNTYTAPPVGAELSNWLPPTRDALLSSPTAETASVSPLLDSATALPNTSVISLLELWR